MLVERYENIRGFFAGCLRRSCAAGLGIAVLMNKGLKAWIQSMKQTELYQTPASDTRQTGQLHNASTELVILLANIMEGKQEWIEQQAK